MGRKQPVDVRDVVSWLKQSGYRFFEEEQGVWFYDEFGRTGLRIAVFPHDYPHPELCGSVAAETDQTFDKWTRAYYIRAFPETESARRRMLVDLVAIREEKHVKKARAWMSFDDEVPEPKKRQRFRNRPRGLC